MSQISLQRAQIEAVILAAIRVTNQAREPEYRVDESPTAVLYGAGSPLDSLGLVSLLIEVEEELREAGLEISLSDERAVSQRNTPFRDVTTLVRYIEQQSM